MKIFSSRQIRDIDKYTIEHEPVSSVDLMERAALALSHWFRVKYNTDAPLVFMAGPGNNGGDAWALARLLFHHGFENIRFYLFSPTGKLSPDSVVNKKRLNEETQLSYKTIESEDDFPYLSGDDYIVDALFGSGLNRPLDGLAVTLIDYINNIKTASIISIDIPSGLFGEDNQQNPTKGIIQADFTLSFQFPKLAFFFSDNNEYVGKWEVLPIGLHPGAIDTIPSNYNYLMVEDLKQHIKSPGKFSHKGTNGHALIVAGSYGMMGACVLATRAAVRSGAGLVTAHMPRSGYEIIQVAVPEALTSIDESDIMYTGVNDLKKYSAVAIGPGLNTKSNTVRAVKELLESVKVPLVIDADALNIIAQNKEWINFIPENTILTPHPGEFDRLTQHHDSHFARLATQQLFSKRYNVIIVLKGAHTSITYPDGSVWFNTTGNPGMAKGGSGDVLTGIICALLAQGYTPKTASRLGVFAHGLAGDIALEKQGFKALTPGDMIENLGRAFIKIEN